MTTSTTTPIPTRTYKPQLRKNPSPTPSVSRCSKLLCIDDRHLHRHYTPSTPVNGHVYCVREVYEDGGRMGVLLVGITGPTGPDGLEQGFFLTRFRWVHD